jgi:hypothetical protein
LRRQPALERNGLPLTQRERNERPLIAARALPAAPAPELPLLPFLVGIPVTKVASAPAQEPTPAGVRVSQQQRAVDATENKVKKFLFFN